MGRSLARTPASPPGIRAAVAGAVDRGVRVSLATGRRPSSAVGFANQLGLTEPIIAHQGAAIRAMPRRREEVLSDIVPQRGRVGRLLYHRPMQPDVIRDAIAWCLGHGLDAHVNDLEEILAARGRPAVRGLLLLLRERRNLRRGPDRGRGPADDEGDLGR